jgi:hypothetical protein
MTTALGRTHCITKLNRCDTLADLARVWAGIAVEYQHEEAVQGAKDDRKAALQGVTA